MNMKSKNRVVGLKQSLKALRNNDLEVVYIAKDADPRVVKSFEQECIRKNVEVIYNKTMKELGKEFGIDIGSAVACIIKD